MEVCSHTGSDIWRYILNIFATTKRILNIKKLCIKSCDSLSQGDLERIKGKEKKEEIKQVLQSTVVGI